MSDEKKPTINGIPIIENKELCEFGGHDIYLVTPATDEEIIKGEYIDVLGIKISSNPKKHAVIKNVK